MGMNFSVSKLEELNIENQLVYKKTSMLELRKPFHIANCCIIVANNFSIDEYEEYNLSRFGPWPFSQRDLQKVLSIALYFDSMNDDIQWGFYGTEKQEFIEKWKKLIKDTDDDWVIIEW